MILVNLAWLEYIVSIHFWGGGEGLVTRNIYSRLKTLWQTKKKSHLGYFRRLIWKIWYNRETFFNLRGDFNQSFDWKLIITQLFRKVYLNGISNDKTNT